MADAAMAQALERANAAVADGEKCLKKFSFFDKNGKFEDAAECFSMAGKSFQIAKAWPEAGANFTRAAELYADKLKSDHEAAGAYQKAAEAYAKVDTDQAMAQYQMCIAIYLQMGKGTMAGNASKKVGEMCEQAENYEAAVSAYSQSVDYFESDSRPQAAGSCREKVASLSAELGNFDVSASTYDALGREALTTNLGKFNAKKWFTNALFCTLARGDTVAAQNRMGEYAQLDYTFEGTREWVLVEGLIKACDEFDTQGFADACAEYDKIKRFDPWTTRVLLTIKRSIDTGAGGADDAGAGGDAGVDGAAEDMGDLDLT